MRGWKQRLQVAARAVVIGAMSFGIMEACEEDREDLARENERLRLVLEEKHRFIQELREDRDGLRAKLEAQS